MADRVIVVGNCQAAPVAGILSKMNPGMTIDAMSMDIRGSGALAAAVRRLQTYDLVLMHNIDRPANGPVSLSEIRDWHSGVVEFPAIIFDGFHPDFFTTHRKDFLSPLSTCHSLIVAACFAEGVQIEEVEPLFNPFTFKILGYFDAFEKARTYLLAKANESGYALSDDFERWKASGLFMYTNNHPKPPVLLSIAQAVARKAGLSAGPLSEEEIEDSFADKQILPVYPPIAKRLGVQGGYGFAQRRVRRQRNSYDLREYVVRAYEIYRQAPKIGFQNMAIQRTAALLREYLRRPHSAAPLETTSSSATRLGIASA